LTIFKTIMKNLFFSTIVGASFASLTLVANAGDVVVVPGTSDPWLAGWPNGTTASSGDIAPDESPVYAGSVTGGSTITWSAFGLVANGPTQFPAGPNGDIANVNGYGLLSHDGGAENNISDILNVPVDALVGVFLGAGVPAGTAPSPLDFSIIGLNYTSLAPVVDQVFYMGDGSTESLTVPTGATRLFLGTMDGYGWYNNPGAFTVDLTDVTPVPDAGSTLAMLGVAFGVVSTGRRKTS
jgi:hypothetical protein